MPPLRPANPRRCHDLPPGVHRSVRIKSGRAHIYIRENYSRGAETLWKTSAPTLAEALAIERETCSHELIKQLLAKAAAERMDLQTGGSEDVVEQCWRRARKRANECEVKFSITLEDALALIKAQEFRCAVSGIRFRPHPSTDTHKAAFRPSLDRINGRKGYVAGNVRFVLVAVNIALNEFGDAVLLEIAQAIVRKHKQEKRS